MPEWTPRERWEALVAGTDCPMCERIASGVTETPFGYLIATFELGQLWFQRNQAARGYCLLISRQHVTEPYRLSPDDQVRWFQEYMRAAQAIDAVYHPDKLNYEILGNQIPHLHAHLLPRYYGDRWGANAVDMADRVELESPEAYHAEVTKLRAALGV
jgi:diadenosine tetraphosphate (Ap4A) HIT family hydrolase